MLQSALARRVAFLIVAAVLAYCGIGRAEAQSYPYCLDQTRYQAVYACPNRQDAYSGAKAAAIWRANDWYNGVSSHIGYLAPVCDAVSCTIEYRVTTNTGHQVATLRAWNIASECPEGSVWDGSTYTCAAPKDCASEPDLPAGSYTTPDIDICISGCKFAGKGGLCVGMTVDAQQQWYCSAWEPTGAECSAGQGDTPLSPSDTDGDGSSDGNDTSPNNPGQGGGGKDGKPQEDGGGKGNGNGPGEGSGNGNTSGGGGNCATPPSSSGDAILAQIAYQTWATRCSIEGAKDGNGNLKTTQGSGSGSGPGGSDGDGTDFGTSNPGQDEEFDPSTVKRFGIPVNASMLDSEAIFGGGTCPVLTVTIYGNTFSSTEIQGWCDLLGIMRALILLFGAFTALRILMGNAT